MADFGAAMSRCGIPYSGGERESFFETLEISTVYSLLQIIDNPRQDVPLIAVLRSPLLGFTPDLLAAIRSCGKGDFYDACCACPEEPVQQRSCPPTSCSGRFMTDCIFWVSLALWRTASCGAAAC